MELAEFAELVESARKVFGALTDAAVWADLFHKDLANPGGKPVPNPIHLPSYAKKMVHEVDFGKVMAALDIGDKAALAIDWIPKLHYIQNDDLVYSIAVLSAVDFNGAKKHLEDIARIQDPDPKAGGDKTAVLARINPLRNEFADSLNLIKIPVTRYPQYYLDQFRNAAIGGGKELVSALQANWPMVKQALQDGTVVLNNAIGEPSDPAAGKTATGLNKVTEGWLESAKVWRDSKKA